MQLSLLYEIACPESEREACLARLGIWPFYAFEESNFGWRAYLFKGERGENFDEELSNDLSRHGWALITVARVLEQKNWNACWEENFRPVRVGSFCGIRAAFHPPFHPPVRYDLLVQPRMAFGTGHHETTYMMIELMREFSLANAQVLDYGCGTAVLAILAARMGAAHVLAIDIEEEACSNAKDNVCSNAVSDVVELLEGDLSVVSGEKSFDFILANINRGVILASLAQMKQQLSSQGLLLISGFLLEDEQVVLGCAEKNGFGLQRRRQKGNWLALVLQHLHN